MVPLESFIVTVGCVVSAVPAVPPPGWVVNDSSPVEAMVRLALLALVAVQPPTTADTAYVKVPAGTPLSVQDVLELAVRAVRDVPHAGTVTPLLVLVT
jgi:hypothetical protein